MMALSKTSTSLYEHIHRHGELFVNPLHWTDHHLRLVGSGFVNVSNTYADYSQERCRDESRSSHHDQDRPPATKYDVQVNELHSLTKVLVGFDRPFAKSREGSWFYFKRQPLHKAEYTIFHRHGSATGYLREGIPFMVGYLTWANVINQRVMRYMGHPGPKGTRNGVGIRLRSRRVAKITPRNWSEDPFYLCVLLALAQSQEITAKVPIYPARLVASYALDKDHIHVYDAAISSKLIQTLRDPRSITTWTEWPVITHKKVPYKPYETINERLMFELVTPNPLCMREGAYLANSRIGGGRGLKRPGDGEDNRAHKSARR
ncbi:hypothetical protein BJX64DRAFT_291195 [Aspergillus heterothallicus]